MPEFDSVQPQRPMVHLKSENTSYNITWEDAEKLASYLKGLKIEVFNLVAISSAGKEFDKKWIVDNKFSLKDAMYLQLSTRVTYFNDQNAEVTEVFGHNVAVLAANIQTNPRWTVERLLEEHGVSGVKLSHFYSKFNSVQEAINKLF